MSEEQFTQAAHDQTSHLFAELEGQIDPGQIPDGSITEPKIGDGAVTTPKIFDQAVIASKLAISSVTTEKISNWAVTADKMNNREHQLNSDFTVTNDSPVAGSIAWSNVKITHEGATYTITNGNTADKYVYWDKSLSTTVLQSSNTFPNLADEDLMLFINKAGTALTLPGSTVFDGDVIIPGTLAADRLIANSITAAQIAAGTITTTELAANTILAANIAAGTITALELAALTLSVSQFIRSNNYVAGSAGWNIDGDGNAEFNDVTVRGTYSTGTTGARLTIESTDQNVIQFWTGQANESLPALMRVLYDGGLDIGYTAITSPSWNTQTAGNEATILLDSANGAGTNPGDIHMRAGFISGTGQGKMNLTVSELVFTDGLNVAGARIKNLAAGTLSNLALSGANSTGNDNDGIYFPSSSSMAIVVNGFEHSRILSTAIIVGGITSVVGSTSAVGVELNKAGYLGGRRNSPILYLNRANTTGQVAVFRLDGTTGVGSISITTTNTAYNTSSDERLKDSIAPVAGALGRLEALRPVNFRWKRSNQRQDGFLAHEVQGIVPEAVTGTRGAVDPKTGEPDYMEIDHSKLVPLLVAAMQELAARVRTLEAA